MKESKLMKKISEQDLYPILLEMGNSVASIDKFQRKRVVMTVVIAIAGIVISLVLSNKLILFGGLIFAGFYWMSRYSSVTSMYKTFKYRNQLEFSKFMRLLTPYLLQEELSIYAIFNEVYSRTSSGRIKEGLEMFLYEINEFPNDLAPFTKFANWCSGSDSAIMFMTTIYDFQQTSFDSSMVDELGELASSELFDTMDNIIELKVRKFALFSTKLTMSTFVITIGYMIGMIIETVSDLKL